MPDCPPHYAAFLEKYGGKNLYGEPNFILHWGALPVPRKAPAPRAFLMPEAFLGPYLTCWCLAEWHPADDFGSSRDWDLAPEMPYPVYGAYLPLDIYKNGKEPAMIDSELLNLNALARMLKVVLHHKQDSMRERFRVLHEEHDRKEAERSKELVDRLESYLPAFGDAVSFAGQVNCNSVLKQKMDFIERNIGRLRDVRSRFPKGPQVRPAAPVL